MKSVSEYAPPSAVSAITEFHHPPATGLAGKRGLIVGVANEHSLAWGAARHCRAAGAELALTWLNDKARTFVKPLAQRLEASIQMPLDVEQHGQLEAVFDTITTQWGRLDFVLHSIAFAPAADLHGRVVDCSREGFARAMDTSCHSFLRYLGADEVIHNYGLMGPVKAALEASVRYLAAELGPAGIRVNAVSPGPVATRAASGIAQFEQLMADAVQRAPL